ncbi:MAG TPA: MATE family efflux transporter, partial [Lachnospiraceae bacterium]|nr:MATE family efflux transporter [Lachnospiraceae bacterium]
YKEIIVIGLPITIQSIFQASYSLVDQLMVGRLGTESIAGSGLGAKFSSLVMVTISAIAAVAAILIAQYHGSQDRKGMNQSFFSCLYIASIVTILFLIPSLAIPEQIMGIYTNDIHTVEKASSYLTIIGVSFIPMAGTLMISAFLRSTENSRIPMYASIVSMLANIIFNYILIFGKLGIPRFGLVGAAYGTLMARTIEVGLLIYWLLRIRKQQDIYLHPVAIWNKEFYKKISIIIIPILVNEFSWSIGENIYAIIYGRLGTNSLAAMTLTNPVQGMFIGLFTGVSSAAIVMIGKRLGQNENEEAYQVSKQLVRIGMLGSFLIGALLVTLSGFYVKIFKIETEVANLTRYILYVFAVYLFVKVSNMILAGGVLRSGGETKITLIIDLIGTWIFGVPLGIIASYGLHLPIYWVYAILSMEEVVRLMIGFFIFRRRKWIKNLTEDTDLNIDAC